MDAETLCDGLGFPEAPRWRDGRLYVSDIAARQVLSIGADGAIEVACMLDDRPSGLGWMPDGALVVVAMHNRVLLRVRDGQPEQYADLSGVVTAELNDMVVDADGRAYVTNFGYDVAQDEPATTGIVVVHPDGSIDPPVGELFRPNGCAITADGTTLVVAETRVHRIAAFTLAADGSLSNQRVFAALPSGTWADGLCLDEEGAVWVADPKGCHCYRVTAGGEIGQVIDTAPMQAIACALGGPDRRTLYLTLGRIRGWDEMAADRQGRIHAYRVDVPGSGWP
jgi:sugar lactone lactonase YvrE